MKTLKQLEDILTTYAKRNGLYIESLKSWRNEIRDNNAKAICKDGTVLVVFNGKGMTRYTTTLKVNGKVTKMS